MEALPHVVNELIEILDQEFPERSPRQNETHDSLMYSGGQRSVIRYLIQLRKEQEDNQEVLT